MQRKFKISYDKLSDDLYIYLENEKSQASVEIAEVVLDINSKGKLVAVEIQSASKWLSSITNKKVYKKDLENISKAEVEVTKIKNNLIIKVIINANQKTLVSPVIIPKLETNKTVLN